jgi:hypothetical protein
MNCGPFVVRFPKIKAIDRTSHAILPFNEIALPRCSPEQVQRATPAGIQSLFSSGPTLGRGKLLSIARLSMAIEAPSSTGNEDSVLTVWQSKDGRWKLIERQAYKT